MSLFVKFNLILVPVFALGLVPTGMIAQDLLVANARERVLRHAETMMQTALAARQYTSDEIGPLLKDRMQEKFLKPSVPAFSARTIFDTLQERRPEYTYKEATLNPSNRSNTARGWEVDLVDEFRRDPGLDTIKGVRETELGPKLYLAHPMSVSKMSCLECHGKPQDAPASMISEYGSTNGFGWHMNEIVGAQIVTVPMSVPLKEAGRTWRALMTSLVVVLAAGLGLLNVLLHLIVIRPVKRLSGLADDISRGNLDAPTMEVKGRDEVSVLARSFQRMRISLVQAMKMLKDD